MKARQRGATPFEYLLALLAVAGLVSAVYFTIDRTWPTTAGIRKGEAAKLAEWQAANTASQAIEDRRTALARQTAETQQRAFLAAQGKADDYRNRWEQSRQEAAHAHIPLASCAGPALDGLPAGSVLLSDQFVREYDAAWTGPAGEPLFADPGRAAGAAAGTAPAVGLDRLLDTHGSNAAGCSADRRRHAALIELLNRLRVQWDRAH